MKNTLENRSTIFYLKSKFFIFRILIYLAFTSIPVYLEQINNVKKISLLVISVFYVSFCLIQWFLIGKEFDYRFKIFIRFNSSVERVVYRIFSGMIICLLIFNIIYILPLGLMKNLFWGFWLLFGLFHSWPTRGKIITESVTTHLYEYKFLDKFEKTIFAMVVIFFVFSIPTYSNFQNPFTLRLNYDPGELISPMYWNFLYVNYLPFNSHPELLGRLWNVHLYVVNVGLFLSVFYIFLRYFFSRRLSLLGILMVISSWPFFKMIEFNLGILQLSGNYLLLFWLITLIYHSSTYRSGAFLGLFSLYTLICNKHFYLQIFGSIIYLFFVLLNKKNNWYKRKILKYSFTGFMLIITILLFDSDSYHLSHFEIQPFLLELFKTINSKAVYKLSILGFIFIGIFLFNNRKVDKFLFLDRRIINLFCTYILLGFMSSFTGINTFIFPFSYMWILPFLCLVPLEYLFNKVKEFRSNVNLIYLFYILAVVLDSHFEVRVKLFFKNFIL